MYKLTWWDRAEVPIAFVQNGLALVVSIAENAKPIRRIANQRSMRTAGRNVDAVRGLMVVVCRPWSDRRCDMAAARERNERCIDVETIRFCRTFELHSVQMRSNNLITVAVGKR